MSVGRAQDRIAFVRENLNARPVRARPDLSIYVAHPGSRLHRLETLTENVDGDIPPYWAHIWPGGAALAQHFWANPDCVEGNVVLDLGAGSGLVGIAAAKAGARRVICSEVDPMAVAAIFLNAALNDVVVETVGDVMRAAAPAVDLVAAGDVFYDSDLSDTVLGFLRRASIAGCAVLVGDIGRAFLPTNSLEPLARYPVRDFGDGQSEPAKSGTVYRFR